MPERVGKKKNWICYALKKAAGLGILLAVAFSCSFSALAAEKGHAEEIYSPAFDTENTALFDLEEPGNDGEDGSGAEEGGSSPDSGTENEPPEENGDPEEGNGDSTGGGEDSAGDAAETENGGQQLPEDESGIIPDGEQEDDTLPDEGQETEIMPEEELETEMPPEEEILLLDAGFLADMGPDAVVNTPDELYKWGIEYAGGEIKGVLDPSLLPDSLLIPEGVTAIKKFAFQNVDITSVIFPDSLISLSQASFADCERLERITFGSGIKTLAIGAFHSCGNIKYVNMSKTSNLEIIGTGVFSNNPKNEIESLAINTGYFFRENDGAGMLDGANVKTLHVVHDQVVMAPTEEEAALDVWNNMMNLADSMNLDKASLREGVIDFYHNNSSTHLGLSVQEYEQKRIIAESYFANDGYDAKTPEELWALCFDKDSAKNATICMITDQTGEGVMKAATFMQFYILKFKDNRSDVCFTGTSAKMEAVYDKLLQQLVVEAVDLKNDLSSSIVIGEKPVFALSEGIQEPVSATGEVQEGMPAAISAADIVPAGEGTVETETEDTAETQNTIETQNTMELEDITESQDTISEGALPETADAAVETEKSLQTPADAVAEEVRTALVQSPQELYRWGIICNDGVISGVSDSSLLPEVLVLPEGVTEVGGLAGQSAIREVVLPDSVETVALQAFMNCTGLERITFGSGIRQIHTAAFLGCGGIQTVDLSRASQMELMGEAAFGMPSENGGAVIGQFLIHGNIWNGGSCVNAFWNVQVQDLLLTQ